MKNISDLENIKSINFPGAHDASTEFCQFSLFASCQNLSINEMLNIGVRVFDLRVDGEKMVHSLSKCKKSRFGKVLTIYDVVEDIYNFLKENPTETVIALFKSDGKTDSKKCLDLFLNEVIGKNPDKWYLEKSFPVLKEVRGKIVLLNRINSSVGIDFSKMPYQGDTKNSSSVDFSPDGIITVTLQDRYLLPRKRKWKEAVMPVLENENEYKNNVIVNYLSSAGIPFLPRYNSKYINRRFLNFDLKEKGKYGMLMVDFINREISEEIIKSNFNGEENYEN